MAGEARSTLGVSLRRAGLRFPKAGSVLDASAPGVPFESPGVEAKGPVRLIAGGRAERSRLGRGRGQ